MPEKGRWDVGDWWVVGGALMKCREFQASAVETMINRCVRSFWH